MKNDATSANAGDSGGYSTRTLEPTGKRLGERRNSDSNICVSRLGSVSRTRGKKFPCSLTR